MKTLSKKSTRAIKLLCTFLFVFALVCNFTIGSKPDYTDENKVQLELNIQQAVGEDQACNGGKCKYAVEDCEPSGSRCHGSGNQCGQTTQCQG